MNVDPFAGALIKTIDATAFNVDAGNNKLTSKAIDMISLPFNYFITLIAKK